MMMKISHSEHNILLSVMHDIQIRRKTMISWRFMMSGGTAASVALPEYIQFIGCPFEW